MGAAAVALGAVTSVAGGVLEARGNYLASRQQEADALDNAVLAEKAAADAEARGRQDAGRRRSEGTRTIQQARAALGSSGIDVASGSALDAYATTAATAELDALTEENNAYREAWGHKMRGRELRREAHAARLRGNYGVASSILGTLSNTAMAFTPKK